MNEKEFATLIQKSSNGFLTANQAENIAAKTTTELKARGKISKEEFQQIFNTHLQAELLPNGKLNDTMLNAVRQVAKTVSPNVVTRTPHYAEEAILSESDRQATERNETLENAASFYANLMGAQSFFWDSPVPTLEEEKTAAEEAPIHKLIEKVDGLTNQINAYKNCIAEQKEKIKEKIVNNIAVSNGSYFGDLSKTRQSEIRAEAEKMFKMDYAERFEAVEKAIPCLEEILQVYEDALKLKQAKKPTEKQVKETIKTLTQKRKSAAKIIEELDKKIGQIIYNPTERNLSEAVILVATYRQVESEFKTINKSLEPFDVHIDIDLPGLPILPNIVQKAFQKHVADPNIKKHVLGR